MKRDSIYEVFIILKGKYEAQQAIKQMFIAKDYKEATIYFQGYIWEDKDYYDYRLYKIGKIDGTLKITPCKVFITGGYETNNKTKQENRLTPTQTKLLYDKVKEEIKENLTKSLELLFDGVKVNE